MYNYNRYVFRNVVVVRGPRESPRVRTISGPGRFSPWRNARTRWNIFRFNVDRRVVRTPRSTTIDRVISTGEQRPTAEWVAFAYIEHVR